MRSGLNSLTGGGAEIFDPIVRDKICRGKETAEEWKEVHRLWHQMGGRSTCTMLFGHIETIEHRVDHLRQLRELQDETGGFTGFVPFAFVPETTELKHIKPASGLDQLRNLAVSRIYLDNFDHITGYWIAMTLPLAQISLNYGVDDLHGTLMEEKIFHMAGSKTPQEQTKATLERTIREAGREPMQRDSYYRPIRASLGLAVGTRSRRATKADTPITSSVSPAKTAGSGCSTAKFAGLGTLNIPFPGKNEVEKCSPPESQNNTDL